MVGATGFEPATSCTPSKCASQAALRPDKYKTKNTQKPTMREQLSLSQPQQQKQRHRESRAQKVAYGSNRAELS